MNSVSLRRIIYAATTNFEIIRRNGYRFGFFVIVAFSSCCSRIFLKLFVVIAYNQWLLTYAYLSWLKKSSKEVLSRACNFEMSQSSQRFRAKKSDSSQSFDT